MRTKMLTCQNNACLNPEWERKIRRGRLPRFCPICCSKTNKKILNDSIIEENIELDRIVYGDSLTLLQSLHDKSVNLIICSPPYFKQRTYTDDIREIGQEETVDQYLDILAKIFKECIRITKEDGSIVFNLGDKHIDNNLQLIPWRFAILASQDDRVKLINEVTWVKKDPTPRQYNRRMVSGTEPFFHFVLGKHYKYYPERLTKKKENLNAETCNIGRGYFCQIDESDLSEEQKEQAKKELKEAMNDVKSGKLFSLRMKIRGKHSLSFGGQEGGRKAELETKGYSIIKCPGNTMLKDYIIEPVANLKGGNHPAIFPVSLVETFISLTTDEGDTILDPFMGSGTTAVAAKKMNRRYIGFELSEEFVKYADKRIKNEINPLRLIYEKK